MSFSAGCGQSKQAGREDQLQQMLTQFFSVHSATQQAADGLWLADKASVASMIEKKYLAGYEAKPDEMQKEEIRERLKSLSLLFRVEGRQFAMLTQVADSVGLSAGTLVALPGSKQGELLFTARMKGKSGEIKANVRYLKGSQPERLEYSEAGFTIVAYRESRSTTELVELFRDKIKNSTSLPQY